jgi:hypothetical protein
LKIYAVGLLAVGMLFLGLASSHQSIASTPATSPQLDIEIAVDGTASMASAIAQARQAGVALTDGVIQLLPDSRFSVVVFRDHGNPAGEYQLVQPFTNDESLVKSALGKIKTAYNPSPDNGPAESYNLAFANSYRDTHMTWRADARKVVLVLGDAEPNGAGTDGLAGCHDRSHDPEGLSTRTELANMRSANRTLIMVREPSSEITASLQCYESLAAGAYAGGRAETAGEDIVSTIVGLIQDAYAPLVLKPDLRAALRSGRSGYTVSLQNPNQLPLTAKSIRVELPSGFRYVRGTTSGPTRAEPVVAGQTLTWSFTTVVAAHRQLRLHLAVRTPKRLGAYRASATASVETVGEHNLVPRTPTAVLQVKRRISNVALAFNAKLGAGASARGKASARFSARQALLRQVTAHGFVLLHRRHGIHLLLRTTRLKLERLTGPTRARFKVHVAASHGLPGCRRGSSGTMLVFNSMDLRGDDSNDAYVRMSLPRRCGGTIRRAASISVAAG